MTRVRRPDTQLKRGYELGLMPSLSGAIRAG
jgi:hypothetical protein